MVRYWGLFIRWPFKNAICLAITVGLAHRHGRAYVGSFNNEWARGFSIVGPWPFIWLRAQLVKKTSPCLCEDE